MNRLLLTLILLIFLPHFCWACACGCGVFAVGTSSMFQTGPGGSVSEEYDFLDQNRNWGGTSRAPAEENDDKTIRSSFFDTDFQYFFNREWGVAVELPYTHRFFRTDNGTAGAPDIQAFTHDAFGDMRLKGIYTGLSPDMSTGLEFGVKLPTGDWQYPNFDRDTEIGSGSTDALLGAYHLGTITSSVEYFVQDQLDQPFLTQGGYRPGTEDDAAIGIYYKGLSVGALRVTPVGEALNSYRSRDRGWAADPANTGYERIILAPALEFDYKRVMVFVDVGFPVYQYMDGDQLVSKELYKVTVSTMF